MTRLPLWRVRRMLARLRVRRRQPRRSSLREMTG